MSYRLNLNIWYLFNVKLKDEELKCGCRWFLLFSNAGGSFNFPMVASLICPKGNPIWSQQVLSFAFTVSATPPKLRDKSLIFSDSQRSQKVEIYWSIYSLFGFNMKAYLQWRKIRRFQSTICFCSTFPKCIFPNYYLFFAVLFQSVFFQTTICFCTDSERACRWTAT